MVGEAIRWFRGAKVVWWAALSLGLSYVTAVEAAPPRLAEWIGSWAASPQPLRDPALTFADLTLRQVVHLSVGGQALRIRLDNTFGDQAVTFGSVHVALQASDGAVVAASDRVVQFGGDGSVTIPQGAQALSDPIDLRVAAEANLAISLYLPIAAQATGHHNAGQTSFVSDAGDHAADVGGNSFAKTISDWYWLAGVDVLNSRARGAIVALGDSITNGAWSTWDGQGRWPDFLARRLLRLSPERQHAVLNAGIDGNKLLLFRECCGNSAAALARLARDVIVQTHASHVLVLLGTNDLLDGREAEAFVAGYRQLIAQLHARGLAVIGATIPPWAGFDDTAATENERQSANRWLRTTRDLDGVVDFDLILRDPSQPARLLPAYDSSDHLHPGPAGYEAMGNAIDLALFR